VKQVYIYICVRISLAQEETRKKIPLQNFLPIHSYHYQLCGYFQNRNQKIVFKEIERKRESHLKKKYCFEIRHQVASSSGILSSLPPISFEKRKGKYNKRKINSIPNTLTCP
jgi:hypothetical protein